MLTRITLKNYFNILTMFQSQYEKSLKDLLKELSTPFTELKFDKK